MERTSRQLYLWQDWRTFLRISSNAANSWCEMGGNVKTTSFHGDVHAVETMDAIILAPSLPVKIYFDEIDKLENYESIFP